MKNILIVGHIGLEATAALMELHMRHSDVQIVTGIENKEQEVNPAFKPGPIPYLASPKLEQYFNPNPRRKNKHHFTPQPWRSNRKK